MRNRSGSLIDTLRSVRGIRVETSDCLSGLLAMSNNIFFGTQVKFFVLRGGVEKPRAHDVILCSSNPKLHWAVLGKHVRFWKEPLMISYSATVAVTKRW